MAVRSLLFIENREALDPGSPYQNPAVEWARLGRAFLDLGVNTVNPSHRVSGGSTLATQIEKIRYSPGGRTSSAGEKLRQVVSASLRAYRDGEVTIEARRRIVRDYFNSLPLAAIPGHGEVEGLGDGLWAWFGADFHTVNRLLSDQASGFRGALRSPGTGLPEGARPVAGSPEPCHLPAQEPGLSRRPDGCVPAPARRVRPDPRKTPGPGARRTNRSSRSGASFARRLLHRQEGRRRDSHRSALSARPGQHLHPGPAGPDGQDDSGFLRAGGGHRDAQELPGPRVRRPERHDRRPGS